MPRFTSIIGLLLTAITLHCHAAEPIQFVLQNGKSILISALSLEGDKYIVKVTTDGFIMNQVIPLPSVDHVYGEKPPQINQAVALTLTGKAREAKELLLPVVQQHTLTAKIPGNFWLDAARTLLVAYALNGDDVDATSIGKEIAEATPDQGIEPFVLLGKALLTRTSATSMEERAAALSDLTSDDYPENLRAYASFLRGDILKDSKKKTEALGAYLSVPCLYPSGGLLLNAAAELQAADLLAELKRREEALVLVNSAMCVSAGTVLEEHAKSRLESLK